MIVVQNAHELANVFQRAAQQLRAEGDHPAAELADVLYVRAVALTEKVSDRAIEHTMECRDRHVNRLD